MVRGEVTTSFTVIIIFNITLIGGRPEEVAEEAKESVGTGGQRPSPGGGDPADTADKIMALLSEIGSNQMLQEEFHPWFWEHNPGKLMTV